MHAYVLKWSHFVVTRVLKYKLRQVLHSDKDNT